MTNEVSSAMLNLSQLWHLLLCFCLCCEVAVLYDVVVVVLGCAGGVRRRHLCYVRHWLCQWWYIRVSWQHELVHGQCLIHAAVVRTLSDIATTCIVCLILLPPASCTMFLLAHARALWTVLNLLVDTSDVNTRRLDCVVIHQSGVNFQADFCYFCVSISWAHKSLYTGSQLHAERRLDSKSGRKVTSLYRVPCCDKSAYLFQLVC